MIPRGLFTQIVMVVVSVSIIFTYIKPKMQYISDVQDNTQLYAEKVQEVSRVNKKLDDLVAIKDSVTKADEQFLDTYLPLEVDHINVQRDLAHIAELAGVFYQDPTFAGMSDVSSRQRQTGPQLGPDELSFTMSINSTYSKTKEFLHLLEQNNYPLDIYNLSVISGGTGFLEVSLDLKTYQYHNYVIN